VVVDAEHLTCYVDGGTPDKSLLVPGPGAPASYDIKNKADLIAEILERVPSERVQESTSPCITDPKA
jgi:anthranilate/para-aminobenzoate synthase component II